MAEGPNLAGLLEKIRSRDAVIGIVGLGYVGLPLALAAAKKGFRVVGFDINSGCVVELNAGKTPLKHIPADEIKAAIRARLFEVTDEFSRLSEPDAIIVCVPTPLGQHREPDLTFVEGTMEAIAKALRPGQLISLESTTYPGTTSKICRPILEKSGLRSVRDFYLAYSPEREDPGNLDFTTHSIPKVVGADGPEALRLALALYGSIADRVVPVSSLETAEAVKISENVFRAVNIALVNELKMVYFRMGVDIFEVIEAAKTKPFGFMPFYPGPGLGGHCIPIDPFYLSWKARAYGVNTKFIELAGEINADMPRWVIDRIANVLNGRTRKSLSCARILIVGVAYKKNIGDVRESPALTIMQLLKERGAEVEFHDPHVLAIPPTRDHGRLAGLRSIHLTPSIIAAYDIAVIIADHDNVDWHMLVKSAPAIVDTRNVLKRLGFEEEKIVIA